MRMLRPQPNHFAHVLSLILKDAKACRDDYQLQPRVAHTTVIVVKTVEERDVLQQLLQGRYGNCFMFSPEDQQTNRDTFARLTDPIILNQQDTQRYLIGTLAYMTWGWQLDEPFRQVRIYSCCHLSAQEVTQLSARWRVNGGVREPVAKYLPLRPVRVVQS